MEPIPDTQQESFEFRPFEGNNVEIIPLSEFIKVPRLFLSHQIVNEGIELISYLRMKLHESGYAFETVEYSSLNSTDLVNRIHRIFQSDKAKQNKKYRVLLDFTTRDSPGEEVHVEIFLSSIEDSLEYRGKNDFGVIGIVEQYRANLLIPRSAGYQWFDATKKFSRPAFPKLALRSSGELVKEIQAALSKIKKFHGISDGLFGKQTGEAISQFQSEYELPVTGEVDEETYYQVLLAAKAGVSVRKKPLKKNSNNNSNSEENIDIQETSSDTTSGYWLIKLKTSTWNIEALQPGFICWFNSYKEKKKRPDYDLFQKVKKGDKILGYADGNYEGIIRVFKVTEELHQDAQQGEIISFEVERALEVAYHIDQETLDFHDDLISDGERRLFELSKEAFEAMLEEILHKVVPAEEIGIVTGPRVTVTLPFFYTEGNHRNKDQLNFENDIGSLAAVMSLANVKPPLAIGLFGKWGSGKSFFMEKLFEKVDECRTSGKPEFVTNVVQVKFNSWHYADANLWASMITKIFEALREYGKNENKSLTQLFEELNSSKELREVAEKKKAGIEKTIENLNGSIANRKEEIKTNENALKKISSADIISAVLSDDKVQPQLKEIKDLLPEKAFNNIEDIRRTAQDLSGTASQFINTFKLAYSFRNGKLWIALLTMVVIISLPFILNYFFEEQMEETAKLIVKYASVGALFLSQVAGFIAPARKKMEEVNERLQSLKETCNTLESQNIAKQQLEVSSILGEIDKQKNLLAEQENEVSQLRKQQDEIQNEIDDITSGRKLLSFIESRVTDQRYINNLGIISWIRKDFEELDRILKLQDEAKEKQIENVDAVLKPLRVDRIILYIDDLDRCNEDIVVKVLEAIHLLLAFPLFVVVVGVDPRWLNNAINQKYKSLFIGSAGDDKKNGNLNDIILGDAATSYDYLEKIFQIPFCLKPITKTGREKLIGYLLKEEMADKKQINNGTDKSGYEENEKSEENKATVTQESIKETMNDIVKPEATIITDQDNMKTVVKQESITDHKQTEIEKEKEEEQKEVDLIEITQKLTFREDELAFMKKISSVFGSSPRTINRFINIYRIIKSHKSLLVSGDFSEDDYGPILILLSIVVGFSTIAQPFMEKLDAASVGQPFQDFLEMEEIDGGIKKILLKDVDGHLLRLPNRIYQNNLELISRFSFRTLLD